MKHLTFETYYEFPLDRGESRLVRLWFKATRAEYPSDRDFQFPRLRIMAMDASLGPESLRELAIWIVNQIPDLAAVQVLDRVTGFGNVIYVDWP